MLPIINSLLLFLQIYLIYSFDRIDFIYEQIDNKLPKFNLIFLLEISEDRIIYLISHKLIKELIEL